MLRWIVVASVLCSACKVVHSSAGNPGDTEESVIGFATPDTAIGEAAGVLHILVSLSMPSDERVVVTYVFEDGNAQAGVDYVPTTMNTLTFEPGELTAVAEVTIIEDLIEEPSEYFAIVLDPAPGVRLGSSRHVVTILGSFSTTASFETPTSFANEDVPVSIGVVLSQPSVGGMTVEYEVGGTASSGDYYALPKIISFPPGSIRELISLSAINDTIDEPDETVVLNIVYASNGSVGPPPQSHTHTIRDNDSPPGVRFTQSIQMTDEGASGTKVVTATVQLTSPSSYPITVPFTVLPSSTASSADYTVLTSSPVSFPPGATAAVISIRINGDTVVEGSEDINLELGTPMTASLTVPYQHTARITNDDCLGAGTFTICPDVALSDAVTLGSELITDSSPQCVAVSAPGWSQNGQPAACIVFARAITVNNTWVWGSRPLVLVATETITITNVLDASAHRGYGGPASNASTCSAPLAWPGPNAGGPGGSFMTTGGDGGAHTNPTGTAGLAGAAVSTPPTVLRGGCPGFVGADNFASSSYGYGGGAVYLVAGTSITVMNGAIINASGDGAAAGVDASNGGSGGGSGGMIVLHAASIAADGAFIVANGGGGAQGGDATKYGAAGGVPVATTPFVAAPGGSGNGGGNGGAGFAQGFAATSGASATNANGAGGGGGGAGYIKSNQPLTGASVSPTPL
jgi:hypothetical protein